MVLFPIVANDGSKVPVEAFVIPEPLHVPPGFSEESVTTFPLTQYGPLALIAEETPGSKAKVVVDVLEHPFRLTVTVYVPSFTVPTDDI